MIVLIKTLQVILALSILILIHEFGHFIFAKIFGIRVDKFFLFFDAGGVKLFSTKSRWFTKLCPKAAGWETEYGIGWLPLGASSDQRHWFSRLPWYCPPLKEMRITNKKTHLSQTL